MTTPAASPTTTESTNAMAELASSRDPEEHAAEAYGLYEQFRPAIPAGEAGWGAAGTLSLAKIQKLASGK
jgi:hypothetical protein